VPSEITFRPLTDTDAPLMHRWLNNPEVARWYGLGFENQTAPTLEQVAEYYGARTLGQQPVRCFVIQLGRRPVGFIQTYRIGDYPEYAKDIAWDDEAWGIDLFIGEDDARGGGFGARVIERFLETEVFSQPGVETAILAPNPQNARGIRCYEKAGFTYVKTVFIELENNHEYVMARRKTSTD
jgi:RimJ/RimL family protein N-acetyltransferase